MEAADSQRENRGQLQFFATQIAVNQGEYKGFYAATFTTEQ
jgi:hypothetical protein